MFCVILILSCISNCLLAELFVCGIWGYLSLIKEKGNDSLIYSLGFWVLVRNQFIPEILSINMTNRFVDSDMDGLYMLLNIIFDVREHDFFDLHTQIFVLNT